MFCWGLSQHETLYVLRGPANIREVEDQCSRAWGRLPTTTLRAQQLVLCPESWTLPPAQCPHLGLEPHFSPVQQVGVWSLECVG